MKYKLTLTFKDFLIYAVLFVITVNMALYKASGILYTLVFFGILFYQFTSLKNSILIFLFFLIFHDISKNIMLNGIEAIRIGRLAFVPFLVQIHNKVSVRNIFYRNFKLFKLIIFSTVIIFIFSQFLAFVHFKTYTFINILGYFFDAFSIFAFIYLVFSKLEVNEIKLLFYFVLFLIFLQSLELIYLAIKYPDLLYINTENFESNYHTKLLLWRNPLFGHKNYWGTVAAYFFVVSLFLFINSKISKYVTFPLIIVNLITVTISLSRRAYAYAFLGVLFIALLRRNFKFIYIFVGLSVMIYLFQPDFVMNRITPLIKAQSFIELQRVSSGHLSESALQFIERSFSIIPYGYTSSNFEYNYTEAYIVSVLYSQGIIGAIFLLIVILLLVKRSYFLYVYGNDKVFHGLFVISTLLLLPTIFSTSVYYFISTKGIVNIFSFVLLFTYMFSELLYSHSKEEKLFNGD